MKRTRVPYGFGFGRQYLVDVQGTVVTWECKQAGHRYVIDHGKGKPARRLGASALALFAHRYWRREGGGVQGHCPRCRRIALAEGAGR